MTCTSMSNNLGLDSLPTDIFHHIIQCFDSQDIDNLRCVSTAWQERTESVRDLLFEREMRERDMRAVQSKIQKVRSKTRIFVGHITLSYAIYYCCTHSVYSSLCVIPSSWAILKAWMMPRLKK
jgi:F-box domain